MLLQAVLAAYALASPSPVCGASATAENGWPSFRGAGGAGNAAAHPTTWSEESNVAWKVDVPGGGWSSPIVLGDKVFVTTAIQPDVEGGGRPVGYAGGLRTPQSMGAGAPKPEQEMVFQVRAYDLKSGELAFEKELARRVPDHGIHPCNTFATETPATDGESIVVYFGMIGFVACLDAKGDTRWTKDLGMFPMTADFGTGSSPVIHGGLVFVQCDNESASFVKAFSVESGEEAWSAERPKGSAWASPIVWKHGDVADLVLCGPDTVTGYDPATGEQRWRVAGMGGSFSATPGSNAERLVFGNSGPMRRGPLLSLLPGAEGTFDARSEEGATAIEWNVDRAGPGFSSPILVDGLVWVVDSQGILNCRDAATGEEIYDERLPDARNVVASLWSDGEHVFILSEEGQCYVVAASPEFELVATNVIEGTFWGTPSAFDGNLLIRSAESLYCIRD
ncbi:MAG: PQQ-binding-like beta-propeller repeat protein [Planctomycetota bacterium]